MFRFILTTIFPAAILGCGGDSADKYMQEGFVHIQQQKYDEAIACYEKAIKMEPRAAALYKKALELKPDHPEKADIQKRIAAGEPKP